MIHFDHPQINQLQEVSLELHHLSLLRSMVLSLEYAFIALMNWCGESHSWSSLYSFNAEYPIPLLVFPALSWLNPSIFETPPQLMDFCSQWEMHATSFMIVGCHVSTIIVLSAFYTALVVSQGKQSVFKDFPFLIFDSALLQRSKSCLNSARYRGTKYWPYSVFGS